MQIIYLNNKGREIIQFVGVGWGLLLRGLLQFMTLCIDLLDNKTMEEAGRNSNGALVLFKTI